MSTPNIDQAIAELDRTVGFLDEAKGNHEGRGRSAEVDLEVCWISLRDVRSILTHHQESP